MLVNHLFNCDVHGDFIMIFNSVDFPDRNFPLNEIVCPECGLLSWWRGGANMSPDQYWSGVSIPEIGLQNCTSKKYLRRYLRTQKITQLTKEDLHIGGVVPLKTNADRFNEYQKSQEYNNILENTISETLDGFGVIDGVK